MKKFDQFIQESPYFENKYHTYLEGIFNYIKEKCGQDIEMTLKKREMVSPFTNNDARIIITLHYSMIYELSNILSSFEYLEALKNANIKINKLIDILSKIDLDCSFLDIESRTLMTIDINDKYFEEHKEFLNSLNTINKYKL